MDDRRIRKSKEALKKAFVALLQKKQLNQIRICELCQLADVNRSTFYNNYNDLDALFQDVCQDSIAAISNRAIDLTLSLKFSSNELYPVVFEVLTYMRENDEHFKRIMTQPSKKRFEEQLYWYFYDKCQIEKMDCTQRYHFLSLLISSCIIIRVWMLENYPISTHEMTQLLIDRSNDAVHHFEDMFFSQAT